MKKEIEVVKCSVNELVEKVNNYQADYYVLVMYKKNGVIDACGLDEYKEQKEKVSPLVLMDVVKGVHYTV